MLKISILLHIALASTVMEVVMTVTTLVGAVCDVAFCGIATGGVDSELLEVDRTANMQGQLNGTPHVSFNTHLWHALTLTSSFNGASDPL